MIDRDTQLMKILRSGHLTSMEGEGISLHEALERTNYIELRKTFGQDDLIEIIRKHPVLVSDWFAYSEDKRTSGGWYLKKPSEIGQVGNPDSRKSFDSFEEAVAQYVLKELDFWAAVQDHG